MEPLPTGLPQTRMSALPGPNETIVSSTHGNAALSDAAHPVSIAHHSEGALLTPSPSPPGSATVPVVLGKVHFPLPTLRSPEEETPRGSLSAGYAIVSTALEVAVGPHQRPDQHGQSPLHGPSKITRADIFAGRELLWSSGQRQWGDSDQYQQQQQQQEALPADRDFCLHIESHIYGEDNPGTRFNDNPKGLGVTLTVEFRGETPGLMVSSVALVQMMGSRR